MKIKKLEQKLNNQPAPANFKYKTSTNRQVKQSNNTYVENQYESRQTITKIITKIAFMLWGVMTAFHMDIIIFSYTDKLL